MGNRLPALNAASNSSSLQVSFASSSVGAPQALAWPWKPRPEKQQHHQLLKQEPHISRPNGVSSPSLEKIRSPTLASGFDQGKEDDKMGGGQVWLPAAPDVPRPRASYNAASLAYLGDCIYEDVFLKRLLKDNFLSEEERNVVRWGKNVSTNHKRATKRAGTAVYCRASSLETLIGYLYLTSPSRLEQLMNKLGLNWNRSAGIERAVSEIDMTSRDTPGCGVPGGKLS